MTRLQILRRTSRDIKRALSFCNRAKTVNAQIRHITSKGFHSGIYSYLNRFRDKNDSDVIHILDCTNGLIHRPLINNETSVVHELEHRLKIIEELLMKEYILEAESLKKKVEATKQDSIKLLIKFRKDTGQPTTEDFVATIKSLPVESIVQTLQTLQ